MMVRIHQNTEKIKSTIRSVTRRLIMVLPHFVGGAGVTEVVVSSVDVFKVGDTVVSRVACCTVVVVNFSAPLLYSAPMKKPVRTSVCTSDGSIPKYFITIK